MSEIKNKLLKLFEEDGEKKATTIITNPESRDPFMLKLKNIYQTCKESALRVKNKIFNAAERTTIDFQDLEGTYKILTKRENQEKNGFERRRLSEAELRNLYNATGITGLNPFSNITEIGVRFRNVFSHAVEMNETRIKQFKQLSPAEMLFAGIAIENSCVDEQIQKMKIPDYLKDFINETSETEKIKAVEFLERNTITLDDHDKKITPIYDEQTQSISQQKKETRACPSNEKIRQAARLLQNGDQESLIHAGRLIKEHNIGKEEILDQISQDMRVFIKHYGFDQSVRLAAPLPTKNMTIEKIR